LDCSFNVTPLALTDKPWGIRFITSIYYTSKSYHYITI